jgi:hypothetical protein
MNYDKAMNAESNYPTYTVSAVADAIGIPVNTLRTWCQRGFGPRVANIEASGEWRKYTAEQIAEFAALKRLSAVIELHPAQMALWDIIGTHTEDWPKAVWAAQLRSGPMHVARIQCQGGGEPEHHFYAGDHLPEFAQAVCQGDNIECVLIVDIGPAVSAAMKALHK